MNLLIPYLPMDTRKRPPIHQKIIDISFCPLKVLVVLKIHFNGLATFIFAKRKNIVRFQNSNRFLIFCFNVKA